MERIPFYTPCEIPLNLPDGFTPPLTWRSEGQGYVDVYDSEGKNVFLTRTWVKGDMDLFLSKIEAINNV